MNFASIAGIRPNVDDLLAADPLGFIEHDEPAASVRLAQHLGVFADLADVPAVVLQVNMTRRQPAAMDDPDVPPVLPPVVPGNIVDEQRLARPRGSGDERAPCVPVREGAEHAFLDLFLVVREEILPVQELLRRAQRRHEILLRREQPVQVFDPLDFLFADRPDQLFHRRRPDLRRPLVDGIQLAGGRDTGEDPDPRFEREQIVPVLEHLLADPLERSDMLDFDVEDVVPPDAEQVEFLRDLRDRVADIEPVQVAGVGVPSHPVDELHDVFPFLALPYPDAEILEIALEQLRLLPFACRIRLSERYQVDWKQLRYLRFHDLYFNFIILMSKCRKLS
jgi:hypothetical protein